MDFVTYKCINKYGLDDPIQVIWGVYESDLENGIQKLLSVNQRRDKVEWAKYSLDDSDYEIIEVADAMEKMIILLFFLWPPLTKTLRCMILWN